MPPKEAKFVHVTHRYYPNRVRFVGLLPHGKGTRDIAIDVDPELICKIADTIRATRHTCAVGDDGEFSIGHALWHISHPRAVMPCIKGSVIDVHTSLRPVASTPGLRTCPSCRRSFALLYICERCGCCDERDLPRDADRAAACCAGDDTCIERDWRAEDRVIDVNTALTLPGTPTSDLPDHDE